MSPKRYSKLWEEDGLVAWRGDGRGGLGTLRTVPSGRKEPAMTRSGVASLAPPLVATSLLPRGVPADISSVTLMLEVLFGCCVWRGSDLPPCTMRGRASSRTDNLETSSLRQGWPPCVSITRRLIPRALRTSNAEHENCRLGGSAFDLPKVPDCEIVKHSHSPFNPKPYTLNAPHNPGPRTLNNDV